jgi:cob(I)alamin adenosyltransferase
VSDVVNLTKIYTRTGDDGSTALGDFSRTSKTDPRLAAYADANEANAAIGVVVAAERAGTGGGDLGEDVLTALVRIQNDLFDVGADLCMPLKAEYDYPPLRVQPEWIDELEADCDRYNADLPNLRSFILPGGTLTSAHLHVATTTVRRAERSAWRAIETYGDGADGGVNVLTAKYLNRLSDLLFILARYANRNAGGDVLWQPGGGRVEKPEKRRRSTRSTQKPTEKADDGEDGRSP